MDQVEETTPPLPGIDATESLYERLLTQLDLNCGTCDRLRWAAGFLRLSCTEFDLKRLIADGDLVHGSLENPRIYQRFWARQRLSFLVISS